MTLAAFLLALGTVARLTRLVNADGITEGFRHRVEGRWGEDSWQAYLMSCPWCVSIYAAAGVFTALYLLGPGHPAFVFPTAALTASYLYGAVLVPVAAWLQEED